MVSLSLDPNKFNPDEAQWQTIYWIFGYTIFIGISWNAPLLKHIIYPFKILAVALHEFGHASACILTGGKVVSITVDPDQGGLTTMRGGNPYITLPAGYIGSLVWGSMMVICGFQDNAAKVASILAGLAFLVTLFYSRNILSGVVTFAAILLFVALWLLFEGKGLRFYILFLGVMNSLYSLWDIVEDLVLRKVNGSDASQYSRICCGGLFSPKFWGVVR
jgi:hypothetical protein